MRHLFVLLILVSGLYIYCGKECLCGEEFIGIWKNCDGSRIELRNDGTCRMVDINFSRLSELDDYKNKRMNLRGTWDYKDYFKDDSDKKSDSDKLQLWIWDKQNKVKYNLLVSVRGEIYPWEIRDTLTISIDTYGQKVDEIYEFKRPWKLNPNRKMVEDYNRVLNWISRVKEKLYFFK